MAQNSQRVIVTGQGPFRAECAAYHFSSIREKDHRYVFEVVWHNLISHFLKVTFCHHFLLVSQHTREWRPTWQIPTVRLTVYPLSFLDFKNIFWAQRSIWTHFQVLTKTQLNFHFLNILFTEGIYTMDPTTIPTLYLNGLLCKHLYISPVNVGRIPSSLDKQNSMIKC